jgi:predicted O-methyltransferase YrrM
MKTWRDVPGWFDYDDIYDEAVAAAPLPGSFHVTRFVELGVAHGRSAIYMAQAIRVSGKLIDFSAIDSWAGGGLEAFERDVLACGVAAYVNAVPMDLEAAARLRAPASVDFVFLDADHSLKGTAAAISAWLPKVRPGGIFAGHDFTPEHPGVVEAVRLLLPGATKRRSSFFWRVPA